MKIEIEIDDKNANDLILILLDAQQHIRREKLDAPNNGLAQISKDYQIFSAFNKQIIHQLRTQLIGKVGTFDNFINQIESKQNEN